MKKILSLCLVLTVLLSCVGCGKTETTNNDSANATESTTETTTESTTETTTESTTESTTETTTEETTTEKKTETTTNKKVENTTTKTETTTKKQETTTKKNTEVTYDGHKPYEVFVDASKGGNSYYYDEYGNIWRAESLTAKPQEPTDECPLCSKENCGSYMDDWHCVVCKKDIAAHECHPKSHLDKSL